MYDEIHAYHVLEHMGGPPGNYRFFFAQFEEFWRILKPEGYFAALVPSWNGAWAWGDPGHCRIINDEMLTFLSQKEYTRQAGKTPITDYRFCYKADFIRIASGFVSDDDDTFWFVLKAIK